MPTMVLLDLKKPRMNGHEVLRFLRGQKIFALLPIVVFSTSDEPLDIAKAMEYGATEYVQKPVDFEKYVRTVEGLIRRYVEKQLR